MKREIIMADGNKDAAVSFLKLAAKFVGAGL